MISDFDDYSIHQNANPVNEPGTSDRNFYDRYWMNGFDRDGAFNFEGAVGIYPNRHVMDAHFSVSIDGTQHTFHGSRRAPGERSDTSAGPLKLEIVRPMREMRLAVADNETGISCDLVFTARTAPTQEPRSRMEEDGRVIMDTIRFAQFGRWQGWLSIDGRRVEVSAETTLGTRDKSWGVRPVGEPEAGAPGLLNGDPGVYWAWCPVHFDDICTQFGTFEDRDGNPTQLSGCMVPAYADPATIPVAPDPGHVEMASAKHSIDWIPGSRCPAAAEVKMTGPDGSVYQIELEPMIRFHLLGLGYTHPEWGHGFWKGEEAIGRESWELDEMDLLDYKHVHVHNICRARMGERQGVATLETVVFGRHDPSGFKELLDGAA